jgi:hypothetical protein
MLFNLSAATPDSYAVLAPAAGKAFHQHPSLRKPEAWLFLAGYLKMKCQNV